MELLLVVRDKERMLLRAWLGKKKKPPTREISTQDLTPLDSNIQCQKIMIKCLPGSSSMNRDYSEVKYRYSRNTITMGLPCNKTNKIDDKHRTHEI